MKISAKSILIAVLAIGCLVLGILYLSKGSQDNRDYKSKIKKLNSQLEEKDRLITEIASERDSLNNERQPMMAELEKLRIVRREVDSLRNIEKQKSHENHNTINDADINELSGIISGLIED